ncbi:transcriptional regulator [Ktedonosporobacter rubrisoli]|uniref:Transcriptional regulator n=1 Tax=Ktedonosporobacter rubrisoli TaxID=2509675 RepID=A0A4P6JT50_KTERU|nr:helix-turn-helix domain-containing protein [Ktedonosporobacter rubrisoli]QBD78749.1 transcriptional regulator [Ktedonosporobacter rubrisoli]
MEIFDEELPAEISQACATSPLRSAICFIGDMWILLIVMHLLHGPMRFNALRESMGHISSKTLSQRLKMLEEKGFVQREAFLEIPPRVEYRLTSTGQELGDVIKAIDQFAEKNFSAK